jgi:hypothetical protein
MEHKEAMNKDNIQIAVDKAREHFEFEFCLNIPNEYYPKDVNKLRDLYEKALSLQADRIKKLDEDWKELDSDCMILHDKNKQLKKENKALSFQCDSCPVENEMRENSKYSLNKQKAEIIDKVCEIIKKMPIFFENEFSEWLEELINQIKEVKI